MKYYSFVYNVVSKYVRDDSETEEIINDVFLKIFLKIEQYDNKYPIMAWIKRITVNKCIDKYRKAVREISSLPLDHNDKAGPSFDPFWKENNFHRIEEVLKIVPLKYRLIFNLYVFEDYKHKEIAEKFGIPIGSSKSAVSRARKIIKEHYSKEMIKTRLHAE